MVILTIPQLRKKLDGRLASDMGVIFEFLHQRGRVTVDGEEFGFPLWPPIDMPAIKVFHRWKSEDFWKVLNEHWNHQCFLEEGTLGLNPLVGFICVRCKVRVGIEPHTYVSENLPAEMRRRVNRIKGVQETFEWHRLRSLGLHMDTDTKEMIGDIDVDDPILDNWPVPEGDGSNEG